MFNIIFTIDYEIHGNGEGSPYKLMIEPTYRIMKLFDRYGAKLTIMADVAEILKFKEYKEKYKQDKYYFDDILEQLKYAVSNGHDVQLHIHSGYFNSKFGDHNIEQCWDEYDLANQTYDTIYARIKECKNFLENNLKLVNPNYKCIAFRAANWSMIPTENISKALIKNQIRIDSSVFKWGIRTGRVKFDYKNANDKLIPWFTDLKDICAKDSSGELLEIPIYTEQRVFWHFITFIRAFRMIRARFHKHRKYENEKNGSFNSSLIASESNSNKKKSKLMSLIGTFAKKHPWKMDINQASGKQLIEAAQRIEKEYNNYKLAIPIVLIGHSKTFIRFNEKTLSPFLKHIHRNNKIFKFSLFGDINRDQFR